MGFLSEKQLPYKSTSPSCEFVRDCGNARIYVGSADRGKCADFSNVSGICEL